MTATIKKSGANIHLELVATTYDALTTGELQPGTAQTPLSANSFACFEVVIVANPANTGNIWIGDETTGCHFPLQAAAGLVLAINDVNKVYARAENANDSVHWIAGI